MRRDYSFNLRMRVVFVLILACCFHLSVLSFVFAPRFALQRSSRAQILQTQRQTLLRASEVTDIVESNLSPTRYDPDDRLSPVQRLEGAWRASLTGNFTDMRSIVSSNCLWQNPLMQDMNEFYESMKSFSELFLEPRLVVFNRKQEANNNKYILDYQLSFTYPTPWRPRIIIPATAEITVDADNRISEVQERWRVSLLEIFTKQFFPRWWDVWHVFSSPSPEYPPMKVIGKQGSVSFMEVESTVVCDVMRCGLAKYFGPPLAVVPGFSLFGELKTTKPKPDRFITVLPVDVSSGKYVNQTTGEVMKRSVWSFHVPGALQDLVLDKCSAAQPWTRIDYSDMVSGISDDEEEEGDDGEGSGGEAEGEAPSITPDFVRDLEKAPDVKSRIMNLYSRGDNITLNKEFIDEYANNEIIQYRYRVRPRRLIAAVDLQGEVNAKMIATAIDSIRNAVGNKQNMLAGKRVEIMKDENDLSMQLCYTKCCFNLKAEPAMAIYESQYKYRKTRVFLELRTEDV